MSEKISLDSSEKQYELQTFPTFWKGQGLHGLCLPSHCLQYKKDVCKTDKRRYELADRMVL